MATTKKPTGLSITRKDNKYIFSWSKPQSYGDGQQLQWSYKASSTHKSSIIKLSGSKKDYTVTSPSKLSEISFKVRGNHDQNRKDPGWSAWAEKSFKVGVAKQPKITTTWEEATPNKTVFTYEVKDDEHYPFSRVEYRTMLVQDYNGSPSSYDWKSLGSPTTSTSKTGTIFDTPESVDPSESWTRIVQIRAVGAGGTPKKWKYATHTYAKPNEPIVYEAKATPIPIRVTTTLDMEWLNNEDSAHPVDKTIIQYKMVTPAAGMTFPPQETPDDADTPVNTEHFEDWYQGNVWSEEIQGLLADDQCLFARIKVTHDTREEVSQFKIAQYGRLAAPTAVTTTPVQGTHTIVVNITDATTVPDAYHAVVYKKDGTESIMGIIPNGSTSVNMVVPPWTDSVGDVGVYAVVGSYTAQPADDDGVVIYTIAKPLMTSDTVWKGGIAAPSINVVQANVEETATVTWSWTDPDATGAEVSWADHEDAWESTDEPDTYIVDASRASRLNVSGLDPGITWYFRVRLVTEGDDTTYGLYSNTFALNLSSAPAIPSLEMSAQVIDPDGEAIASWVYVSGDNTPQAHATLALYNGTYTDILQVNTEQTAVIKPAKLELAIGSYQLAVKVESESGQWSDYSDPIPFAVAEPLTCAITQTSLVSDTEPINPETLTGNPIIYDAGDPAKEVKNLDVELTPIQDLHGYDKPWNAGAGKNKFGYKVSDFDNGSLYGMATFIPMNLALGTYTISTNAPTGNLWVDLYQEGEQIGLGSVRVYEGTPYTFNVTETYSAAIGVLTADKATALSYKTQLETGSTATTFEPYANICPITGHDSVTVADTDGDNTNTTTVTLPHTVYGAGVGVTSGSGKDKYGIVTLQGALNENWQLYNGYNGFRIDMGTYGMKSGSSQTGWSDSFEVLSEFTSLKMGIALGAQNTYMYMLNVRSMMQDITDVATWKTYLASHPLTVVYPLATPTDLSTTPTDITLYSGDNVISSDGDMELTIADAVLDGYFLKEMPLTATVTGAGETGQTVLAIKRKNDYSILRPDDTELTGYADEVICQYVYTGEAQRTINIGDVLGKLNDGATYYLEATVTDNLGRTSEPVRYPADDPNDYFTVMWDLQAIMPEATAEIIDDYYAKLTITKPQDWYEGDTVDIYRLTSDKPQLIADGVEMEDTPVEYVDPYPTLGEGGYRFVYRTQNGDDTLDSANNFAWLDIPLTLESQEAIIDFNGERLPLGYNLKVSNSWSKDFQETRYLGGHIAGDWTAGVSRTASVDTVTIPVRDPSLFKSIRRLAEYEDICHLRTLDGSVITCNIDVDDDFGYDTAGKIQNVKMSITRVDPVDNDSMLLSDWLVTP